MVRSTVGLYGLLTFSSVVSAVPRQSQNLKQPRNGPSSFDYEVYADVVTETSLRTVWPGPSGVVNSATSALDLLNHESSVTADSFLDIPTGTSVSAPASTSVRTTSSPTTSVSAPGSIASISPGSCDSIGTNGAYLDSNGQFYNVSCETDHNGGDLSHASSTSFSGCFAICDSTPGCVGFAYVGGSGPGTCYLKSTLTGAEKDSSVAFAARAGGSDVSSTSAAPSTSASPLSRVFQSSIDLGFVTTTIQAVSGGMTSAPGEPSQIGLTQTITVVATSVPDERPQVGLTRTVTVISTNMPDEHPQVGLTRTITVISTSVPDERLPVNRTSTVTVVATPPTTSWVSSPASIASVYEWTTSVRTTTTMTVEASRHRFGLSHPTRKWQDLSSALASVLKLKASHIESGTAATPTGISKRLFGLDTVGTWDGHWDTVTKEQCFRLKTLVTEGNPTLGQMWVRLPPDPDDVGYWTPKFTNDIDQAAMFAWNASAPALAVWQGMIHFHLRFASMRVIVGEHQDGKNVVFSSDHGQLGFEFNSRGAVGMEKHGFDSWLVCGVKGGAQLMYRDTKDTEWDRKNCARVVLKTMLYY